jgi:CelD/BcsL family acetyltransferase involved in cellulose biosynthesis
MQSELIHTDSCQGPNMLDLQIYTNISSLESLASQWNTLVDNSVYPNVFLRWEWVSTWWKWFGQKRSLNVVVIRDDNNVVGIVPWYIVQKTMGFAGRMLKYIGSGGLTYPEYLGPIVHRDYLNPVICKLLCYLRLSSSTWDVIEFPDVPPDDSGTNELIKELSKVYPFLLHPGEVCVYVELPETFNMLLTRLSSQSRWHKKKQLRRVREECKAKLEILEDVQTVRQTFPTMVKLSVSSRTRLGQFSPFINECYSGFHQETIDRFCHSAIIRIYLLKFHDHPVAFMYGFLYQCKYYAFQTGFNNSEVKYSPGDALLQMVLEHLISQHIREFDYLRGEESYKSKFGNKCRLTKSTWIYRRKGVHYHDRWLRLNIIKPLRRQAKQLLKIMNFNMRSKKSPYSNNHIDKTD